MTKPARKLPEPLRAQIRLQRKEAQERTAKDEIAELRAKHDGEIRGLRERMNMLERMNAEIMRNLTEEQTQRIRQAAGRARV